MQSLVNDPSSNMFVTGEVDESAVTPVFCRRSFVDGICFGGSSFKAYLATLLDRLLIRFTECHISIRFTTNIFVQSHVDFLLHKVTGHGITEDLTKLEKIAGWSFPTSKRGYNRFLEISTITADLSRI